MGWDASNISVVENIFKPFLECCLDENCIAPAYAMAESHRFADTALSLAANRLGDTLYICAYMHLYLFIRVLEICYGTF